MRPPLRPQHNTSQYYAPAAYHAPDCDELSLLGLRLLTVVWKKCFFVLVKLVLIIRTYVALFVNSGFVRIVQKFVFNVFKTFAKNAS